jgi:hypothetical protein
MSDLWGVVANSVDQRRFRRGAKVWLVSVTGGGLCFGRARFYGLSPGGRSIECWEAFKRLENFRTAWVPEHLRDRVFHVFESHGDADQWARDIVSYRLSHKADVVP